jgi:hypothetical protein
VCVLHVCYVLCAAFVLFMCCMCAQCVLYMCCLCVAAPKVATVPHHNWAQPCAGWAWWFCCFWTGPIECPPPPSTQVLFHPAVAACTPTCCFTVTVLYTPPPLSLLRLISISIVRMYVRTTQSNGIGTKLRDAALAVFSNVETISCEPCPYFCVWCLCLLVLLFGIPTQVNAVSLNR